MGLGMPIPDLSNKPGPGRPGFATGAYEFQFEVDGQVTFKADAAAGGGSFTVKWPNGSSQSYSGNNSSITAPDATAGIVAINNKLDSGYCDEFAVTGGKDKVKKVISWGERPWRDLSNGFNACTNLTNIENTKLIGGANCNLTSLFINCTGLTDALCENWDLSSGCSMLYLFEGCTNLELLNLTGSKFATTGSSSYAFHDVGSATTNGCEFKMSGLDFTGSTVNSAGMYWFKLSKFKDGSNLSNWTFDSALNSFRGDEMFNNSIVNGTLDLSNWAWPNEIFPSFSNINSSLTSQNGSKIKLSNWGVSVVNNFSSAFNNCNVYELEGLSTWGACAGNATIYRMFRGATLMRINPNDNFSNSFMASLTPTYAHEAFYLLSSSLQDSERGPSPNLNGLDFSNLTSSSTFGLKEFMRQIKVTDIPDFSNVTFSSTNTVSFEHTFYQFDTTGTGSNSIFNFNPTVKPANFTTTFYFAHGLTEVNIGSNVNMSDLTSINGMFYAINHATAATPFTNATFPTNADFSSLTNFGNWVAFAGQVLSPCQVDNFFRRLRATNNNSNITANFYSCKVTEAPSLVRSDVDYFTNTKGWNITLATPDAALPFAYASYFVDPTGITTISPTVTPPAGSVFTATNGLNISASGVITIGSFRGSSTIRCTYPDGCYNEVLLLIQVPFKMTIEVPNGGIDLAINYAVTSAGEYAVDWGDGVAEIVSGNKTHTWSNSTGSPITREMSFFDSPSGSVFKGFSNWYNYYNNNFALVPTTSTARRLRITQWGEIKWDSAGQFQNLHDLDVLATDAPDLSETTTLAYWFSQGNKRQNPIFTNANDSLSTWDVSGITDMNRMFWNMRSFQGDLSSWDVSNVTNMGYMFASNSNYQANANDCNINTWDTSSLTDASGMFYQNNGNTYICCTQIGTTAQLVYGYPAEHQLTSNITGATDGVYTGVTATNIDYSHAQQVIPTFEITVQGGTIVKARPDQYVAAVRNNTGNRIEFDTSSMGGTGNGQITLYGRWNNNLPGNTNTERDLSNWKTSNITNFSLMFYTGTAGNTNFNTKMVNGTLRWDIGSATNFGNWWYQSGPSSSANWPSNWKIPSSLTSLGNFAHRGMNNADVDSFSTKTVNETWYGGTSYTAWDVSNISSFNSAFNYGNLQSVKNYNIGTWNVTSSATDMTNLLTTDINGYYGTPVFDQDLGHWDVRNVTGFGENWLGNRRATLTSGNLSTANLDSIYDITDGWGQDAGVSQSGVVIGFGTSKYTPGISIEGTTNNTGTSTTIYDSTKNFTNEGNAGNIAVGDILYNKDTNQYAKVLSFGTYTVVTDQSIWGSSGINYRVENSNAARGKIALISAGWTITDGGAYIPPVVPMQLQFTVASNTQTTIEIPYVQGTSFTIDWGDGFTETSAGSNNRTVSHTYNDGTNTNVTNPTVSINAQGDASPMTGFDFGTGGSKTLLIDIPAWGNTPFTRFRQLLHGCSNLNTLSATDAPILSGVTNFYAAFNGTGTMGNADLTSWDMSSATYTGYMFQSSQFNGNISNWDVSNVTNMAYMFQNTVFTGDLTNWDVSNVATSNHMFNGGSSNPDIAGWDMAAANNQYFWAWSNTAFNPSPFLIGHTVSNQNWKYMNNHSAWTTNNWTDFLVLNANAANARSPKTPIGADFTSNSTGYRTVDTTRTYSGTGFQNAGRAISFLSADVTVSGGSSAFNGVYGYNYTTQKWVKDGDTTKTIEWNATESMWEVLNSGVSQYEGTGGTQGNGPESSTSWTGGITVVDSSLGWTLFTSIIS